MGELKMWGTNEDGTLWEKTVRCSLCEKEFYILKYYWQWEKWEFIFS